jgi:DNA replication protein DnaC
VEKTNTQPEPGQDSSTPETTACSKDFSLERALAVAGFDRFLLWRGERYRHATLNSFEFHGRPEDQAAQEQVVARAKEFACSIWDSYAAGQNVLFLGPVGTGKDHLATALVRCLLFESFKRQARAHKAGESLQPYEVEIKGIRGVDLMSEIREARTHGISEREWVANVAHRADLLYIDDVIAPSGQLENWEVNYLKTLLDAFDGKGKPVWLTANGVTREAMQMAIGAPNYDRLRLGAEIFVLDWPSYRKPARITGLRKGTA